MKPTILFILFILPFFLHARGQRFTTQGDQEKYWAQKIFDKNYERHLIPKYGKQIIDKGNVYQFGTQTLAVSEIEHFKPLFKEGIIYPGLILPPCPNSMAKLPQLFCGNITITNLEELTYLKQSDKSRRFSCLVWREGIANPQRFYFELYNEGAGKETPLNKFIMEAQLVFFKVGSILI